MTCFDAFNGDADGLCALHQLRLVTPREATLVTGVKRDINLLSRVDAGEGDEVTVLDISLDKNRDDLVRLLDAGARALYFDHHYPGDIPVRETLETHIDASPEVCTSLLVNAHLKGRHLPWAVTGAFGDNLHDVARQAAEPLDLDEKQLELLTELGTCLNYNGYGVGLEDLFFHPADLYRKMRPYEDPFVFIAEESAYRTLADGYASDMANVESLPAESEGTGHAVFLLPDEVWARRVSGVFGNLLARRSPDRAHAVLNPLPGGGFRISVRAPLSNRTGADELCRAFPTGGGRAAAAGINNLDEDRLDEFVAALAKQFD